MKSIITKTVAAGAIAAFAFGATSVEAADATVSTDFVTAYVFRGVTLNKGFVIQPGIEVGGLPIPEEAGSVALGTWGNYDVVEPSGTSNDSEFQEIDWYGSYALPTLIDGVDISLGYTHYAYGGSSDKEASIGLGYAVGDVGLSATYYQGVGGGIGTSVYVELGAGYDVAVCSNVTVSIGGTVAYADRSDNSSYWGAAAGENGLSDYSLSIGTSYALCENWSAGASIAYIGQIDDDVLTDSAYDIDLLGGLNLSASF